MVVFGAMLDHEEQPLACNFGGDRVEKLLGFGIDRMQVFDHHDQRTHAALPLEERRDCIQRAPVALRRVRCLPDSVISGNVEQRKERRDVPGHLFVECRQATPDPYTDPRALVACVDGEVKREQFDHRKVGDRLAVGRAARLEHRPSVLAPRLGEFPQEARLPDAGLADDRDNLATPRARQRRGPLKHAGFKLTADKTAQAAPRRHLEAGA